MENFIEFNRYGSFLIFSNKVFDLVFPLKNYSKFQTNARQKIYLPEGRLAHLVIFYVVFNFNLLYFYFGIIYQFKLYCS